MDYFFKLDCSVCSLLKTRDSTLSLLFSLTHVPLQVCYLFVASRLFSSLVACFIFWYTSYSVDDDDDGGD